MGIVHVISKKDKTFLFNRGNFKIYELNPITKELFTMYEAGVSSKEISKKLEISDQEVCECLNLIVGNDHEVREEYDKILGAFLMISQNCNLRCKYCYADYGRYGESPRLMNREVAKKSVDYLISKNNNLEFIQFFGGEPTLNTEIIGFVIKYFNDLKKIKRIDKIPFFTLVTNLVSINDEFIDLVKHNNINVTVSIDGPREIHDKLRYKANNGGTYDEVLKNYNRLVEEGIVPNIEATYTKYHEEIITISQLYKFFHENFVYNNIFISPIACSSKHTLYIENRDRLAEYQVEAMEMILDSMTTESPIRSANIQSILETLLNKKSYSKNFYICPDAAGICQLAINADGDVYPCYALLNTSSLKMSDIFSNNQHDFEIQQDRFKSINKDNKVCKDCWVKNLCSICLASQVFMGNEYGKFNNSVCKEKKYFIENLISKLIEIQSNEHNVTMFNNNFYINDRK